MDEVLLRLQLKVVEKPGDTLPEKPTGLNRALAMLTQLLPGKDTPTPCSARNVPGLCWRNHNKCRKWISAFWVPHRPQTSWARPLQTHMRGNRSHSSTGRMTPIQISAHVPRGCPPIFVLSSTCGGSLAFYAFVVLTLHTLSCNSTSLIDILCCWDKTHCTWLCHNVL